MQSNTCEENNFKILSDEKQWCSWNESVKKKIIIYGQVRIMQVNNSSYLGCKNSYQYNRGCENKIEFGLVCGVIDRNFKLRTRKDTRNKIYNAMAVSVLLHGVESWMLRKSNEALIAVKGMLE